MTPGLPPRIRYYTGLPVKTFALRPNQSTEEQVTTTTYDFADRPLRTTAPTGSYVELGYWDNLLRQTTYTKRDVVNGVDQLVYSWQDFDGAGHKLRQGSDHPNNNGKYSGQKFQYDGLGRGIAQSNLLTVLSNFSIDEAGTWQYTAAEFDGMGRTTTVEKPDNTYLFNDYSVCGCAGGLQTDQYDERNNRKTTESDFRGRLQYAREYEPQLTFDYDLQEWYISDYLLRAEVEYQYDALDRLTSIIHRTGWGTSSAGKLTGPGQTRTFTYDLWGRTQNETTPEAGTTSYTYNANDQIATTTNANNKITTVTYNTRNLVTGISYNDSTPSVSYGYDDYGARSTMTDGEGAMSYTYNSYRQLSAETRTFTGLGSNQYTFNYTYNLGGQLTRANYVAPSFNKNVNYAYNGKGALNGIGTNLTGSDPNTTTNVISAMSYKAFGAASSISYGNNRTATLSYNSTLMRLTSLEVARPNGSDRVLAYNYAYLENGLLGQVQDVLDSTYLRAFEYNYRNQLTKTTGNWSQTVNTYSYDDWGNLTNRDGGSLSYATGSGSVPTTNRVTSTTYGGTTNFSYDSAGNMTAANSTTYQWDAANRLKSVNNGALGSYGYDGNGKRVKKTESGTTTYYVYSTFLDAAVMEVASTGVQRAYVSGGRGQMVALLSPNGNFYWIHQDHLGSGRKMTDTSGNMIYRAEFDPYGKLLYEWSSSSQPNLNTKKFTGYERDAATGLDYAQARYYSADWGRFMTPDPMGLSAAGKRSPKTLNRYSYVGGNPTNFLDPKGTCFYYWREVYEGYWKWEDMFCYEETIILQPELPPATPEPVEPIEPPEEKCTDITDQKEIADIRAGVDEIAKQPSCKKFIEDVFGKLTDGRIGPAENGDLLKIFDKIISQGGLKRGCRPKGASPGSGGNYTGSLRGSATIYIPKGYEDLKKTTSSVFAELFHAAGGSRNNGYTDGALARAAYNAGYRWNVPAVTRELYPGNPNHRDYEAALKNDNHGAWSSFFHGIERGLCKRE